MKRFILINLLAGLMLLIQAPLASAVSINLVPSGMDLNVVVSNLGGQIVSAYQMNVSYDTSANLTGIDFSNLLGDPSSSEALADSNFASLGPYPPAFLPFVNGSVDFYDSSLLFDADLQALQNPLSLPTTPDLTLATLHFDAAPATYQFNWDQFHDVKGLLAEQIFPAAIPEPSTILLIGSGLLGLVGFRRKFKK